MRYVKLFFLILLFVFSSDVLADNGVYKIDIGISTLRTSTTGWNNFDNTMATGTPVALVDSLGATSTVSMNFVDGFDCGSGNQGTSGSPLYPSSATLDYLSEGGCPSNATARIIFTGLNPSWTYNVRAFSARAVPNDPRNMLVTVGAATSSVVGWDMTAGTVNNNNIAQINNFAVSATGSVAVDFSRGPGNAGFYHLNAVELIANTPNIPPGVNAGMDQVIQYPTDSIQLNSLVNDSDGTIASSTWSIFQGDAYATFASTTATSTTVSNLYPGRYTFRMTAMDNSGAIVTDDVVITVLPASGLGINRPAKRIVVIGSSIAEGYGSIPVGTYENSWVRLLEQYMKMYNASSSITNIALAGQTTFNIMPTGSGVGENINNNITKALTYNPDIIVISLTTNDANFSIPLASSTQNLATVVNIARAAGIQVWVTTTSGRGLSSPQLALILGYKDMVLNTYGTSTPTNTGRAINFFDRIANPDGTIKSPFGNSYLGFASDSVHVNNFGHAEIFRSFVESNFIPTLNAMVPNIPQSLSASASTNSVTLSWSQPLGIDPVAPVTSYRVYNADTGVLIDVMSSTTLTAVVPNLNSATNYSYYVSAVNSVGESSSSTIVSISTGSVATPASYWSPGSSGSSVPASLMSAANPVQSAGNLPQAAPSFTRSLSSGMRGNDVKSLQQYLNSKGFPVAPSGVGSKGKETTLFGPATRAALIRFQKANGIAPAVGFFGPVTRAAIK